MAVDELKTGDSAAELVVVCTLSKTGLATQSRRWQELRARSEVKQLATPDGKHVYFRRDEGVVQELTELIAIEQRCCSWAAWNVDLLKREIVLHVTSTGHGVNAIHAMFTGSLHAEPTRCDECG